MSEHKDFSHSDAQDHRFSLGRFSVTKPVLINILMITILALGAFSILRLPQEQFAEVPFYWVNIIVPYPGASAEDLESSVTIPVENAFQGISKLKGITLNFLKFYYSNWTEDGQRFPLLTKVRTSS
jgi:hypothetical protein